MSNIFSLTELAVGQRARVHRLSSEGTIRRRLRDIGLIEGTGIECLFKSPGKDPAAYLIRGAVIALRREDTENITVSV